VVDATSMSIEDKLEQRGVDVEIQKKYRIKETTMEQNLSIINMMAATSVIIILISMVGLTSNLTMNILDRTREIGVMRCIGSVASKIRTVFTTEVLTLTRRLIQKHYFLKAMIYPFTHPYYSDYHNYLDRP